MIFNNTKKNITMKWLSIELCGKNTFFSLSIKVVYLFPSNFPDQTESYKKSYSIFGKTILMVLETNRIAKPAVVFNHFC